MNLWYADASFELCLDSCVTVWTTHICSSTWTSTPTKSKTLTANKATNLFPERNVKCGLRIRLKERPLNLGSGPDLGRIVSLDDLISGSMDEHEGVALLVCVIKIENQVEGLYAKPCSH